MNEARGKTSWYGKDPSRRSHKLKGAAIAASAGLAAAALAAVPASATIVNVEAGHNITVFHNIDFVAATGWAVGESLTMTVTRNGTQIGTSTGLAADPEATGAGGLEVNHGPEAAAVDGDCWVGNTPDIRHGDRVTVTNGTLTDEVIVDNIAFTGDPQLQRNGNITVPFVARRANGNAIPAAFIDSGEFRAAANNSVRFEGVPVVRRPGGAPGQYNLVYRAPYQPSRNDDQAPFNQRQLRRALLGDGHAVGFGHVDPLPLESMLQDGVGDTPGPAPGCEAAPSAQWGVTTAFPGSVNAANLAGGLTVRGIATGADAVNVSLRDGTAPVVTGAATLTGNTWNIRFTRAQLRSLNGNVRVVGSYVLPAGTITGKTMTVLKDVVRPNAPRASLRQGTYRAPRRTALLSAAGNTIRYTVGAGRQARPTANRGAVYRGRIRLAAPKQVIKAVAIDRAGNVSPVKRLVYRIR
jgi:hypothetical protein